MAKNGTNGSGKNGSTPSNTWAGAGRRGDGKIRVAIVGVGNCASSLVQGRYYYENADDDDFVPGLMHVNLGGYHVRDIDFVAAFDIDKNKVGKDLAEAIYTKPNNTYQFHKVEKTGVTVERGMTHDGLGKYLSEIIEKAPGQTADIVGILKEREVDVMVSYLPVGSENATKWYAEQALAAGVGFINAIPVFIGREPYWQRRFAEAGLPVIGDDIKSQVGATISHRVLTRLFMDRGVRLDRTYQLNFGGNTDFLNMLERERLESKKISKTNAVTSMLDYDLDPDDVHVGPSDHVPWLLDRKWCYIRMEGTTFGDVPLNAELKLEVWDSPNSAGVITDAIRCLKLGLDRGLSGTLVAPSGYFMKSPPQQIHDDIAFNRVEAFIRGDDNETLVGTESPGQAQAAQAGRRRRPGWPPRRRDRRRGADRRQGDHGADHDARAATRGTASTRGQPPPRRRASCGRRLPDDHLAAGHPAGRPDGRARSADSPSFPTWSGRPSGTGRTATSGTSWDFPPDHPDVRRLALRAYREYGRYLVELMRLPSQPHDHLVGLVPELDMDEVQRLWHEAPGGGGLIFAVAHVGNNEAVAAAVAHHGMPVSVVADDSSFPEIFELLREQRESWGVHVVAWRNLREIFRILRNGEMLALLVDWGYRADGIPVRLFGSWTALPAGPATLAAKTGSRILSLTIRREPSGTFHVSWSEPIDLASSDPASLQRATQAMADALQATVAAAPEQWYSFKPIWPSDPDEIADLERRAGLMIAGHEDPGPSRS